MEDIDLELVCNGIMFGQKDKHKVKRSQKKEKEKVIVKSFISIQQAQSTADLE